MDVWIARPGVPRRSRATVGLLTRLLHVDDANRGEDLSMVGVRRPLSSDEDGAVFAAYRLDLLRYATALVGPSEAEDVVMSVVG